MPTAARRTAKRTPRKPAPASLSNLIGNEPERETLDENPSTEPISVPEPTSPRTKAPARPRSGSLEARLSEAFASVSLIPSFVGDQYSSFIIASRSDKFAHDLAELAKVNPRVKRTLEGLLNGGAYGGLMFSGMALLLPIMWSYGIIPAPPFDPFSAFYPSLPDGVVPRSATRPPREARKSPQPGSAGPVERVPVTSPQEAPGAPMGVVTVRPNAVPPVSAAAATQ